MLMRREPGGLDVQHAKRSAAQMKVRPAHGGV
jgi:hypothetical protein